MNMQAVTVCIPAYRAGGFLAETLRSVLRQDFRQIHVAVSVDPAGDATEQIARNVLKGARARVAVQPRRLGWVGNANAALRMAETPYAMLMPHDDLLEPDYVSACMAALRGDPTAVLAYSDLDWMHGADGVISETSVRGTQRERTIRVVARHFNAVALRGVFNRAAAPRHLVPGFAIGDFAADTLWVARMAAQGAMVRVPRVLYHKRYKAGSVHDVWKQAAESELEEMWVAHCVEMLRVVMTVRPGAIFDPDIREAARQRLRNEHVGFLRAGLPAVLDHDNGVSKALRVYAMMRACRHRYSWMA